MAPGVAPTNGGQATDWQPPQRDDAQDESFHLHLGRIFDDALSALSRAWLGLLKGLRP